MKRTTISREKGSIHIILISAIVAVLVGVVGFLFWRNFIVPKDSGQSQPKSSASETKNVKTPEPAKKTEQSNEGYLVLKDWKIKFKLPPNVGGVRYYKVQGNDVYEFTTERVEALGKGCGIPNDDGIITRLASLSRSSVSLANNPHAGTPINNNQPIGGYYYYAISAQSICADKQLELQVQDRTLIFDMIENPLQLLE